jgi:hypothetical protein
VYREIRNALLRFMTDTANYLRTAAVGIFAATILSGCLSFNPVSRTQWYKGNTHTHTVICGHADSPPEVVAQWYLERDYNFLILSEHNQFIDPTTVELPADRRQDFILVPGVEVTGHRHVHSTAMNVEQVVPWIYRGDSTSLVIQNQVLETKKAGGETILNHPNFRNAVKAADMQVDGLHMFELYNGHPSVDNEGDKSKVSTETMWDQMLTAGMAIYGVSSDDAHHFQAIAPNKSNPGRGWVMVQASALTPDALTQAMLSGNFYASNGVYLKTCKKSQGDYRVEVDDARTAAELVSNLKLRGKHVVEGVEGYRIAFIGPNGKELKAVDGLSESFQFDAAITYVRAKVTYTRAHPDKGGFEEYYAWGQPVFTDNRTSLMHSHK